MSQVVSSAMYHSITLASLSEQTLVERCKADPRWSLAESADFWERFVFSSPGLPPVGLYLGRGVGPTRAAEREKKIDTWPTPFDSDPGDVCRAIDLAVASLQLTNVA
jgi:hypothetical protein